ncbi:MAG: T9SS type A sorting domain-containing protein, partial [Bacteroidota bacterium]
GSSGGHIWAGNPNGDNWQVLNDPYQLRGIEMVKHVQMANGSRLLVSSSSFGIDAMRYSDDNGQTWTVSNGLDNIQNWGRVLRSIANDDGNIYVLALEWSQSPWGRTTSVYHSADFGTSFSRTHTFHSGTYGSEANFDIWMNPDGSGPVYLLEDIRIFTLGANGTTNMVGSLNRSHPDGNGLLSGHVDSTNTYLYVLYDVNNQAYVHRSADGGANWTFQATVNTGLFFWKSFSASEHTADVLYTGGINSWRSTDGGLSWTEVNDWAEYYNDPVYKLHADIPGHYDFIHQNGNPFSIVCTDGGAYVSWDNLQSVENISLDGLNVSQYYSTFTSALDPAVIFAGAQDQGFQRSSVDDGSSALHFLQVISGDYGHLVSANGGNSLWCNYPGFSMHFPTTVFNNNLIFADFGDNNMDMSGHLWLPPIIADPQDPLKAYLGGGRINGGGAHMIELNSIPSSNTITHQQMPFDFSNGTGASISAMAISGLDNDRWYVMTDNESFHYSVDGGNTWAQTVASAIPGSHFFYGNSILPSKISSDKLYIAGSGYSNPPVYVSNDNGQSFQSMSNGLPNTLVYDIAATDDESLLFAATELGPYMFVQSDNQWYPMEGVSAPAVTYWSVEYVPALHAARFGTYGRGVWDFIICDDQSPLDVAFDIVVGSNGLDINLDNQTNGAYFYTWDFGDGTTSEAKNPASHQFASSGSYAVQLIASNHCLTDTITKNLSLTAVSNDVLLNQSPFVLYPNPSHGRFFIEGEEKEAMSLRLLDVSGKMVWQEHLPAFSTTQSFDLTHYALPTGVYVLELFSHSRKQRQTQKIVLE